MVTKKLRFCTLSLHREGIQEYLNIYSDKVKFRELTGIQIPDEEPKTETQIEEDKINEMIKDVVKSESQNSDTMQTEATKAIAESSNTAFEAKIVKDIVASIQKEEIMRLETEPDLENEVVIQQTEDSDKKLIIESKPEIISNEKLEEAKSLISPPEDHEVNKDSTEKIEDSKNAQDSHQISELEDSKEIKDIENVISKEPNQVQIEEVKQDLNVSTPSDQANESLTKISQNTELIIGKSEEVPNVEKEELINTESASNQLPDDLFEDKDYLDDLNLAIKQSMEESLKLKDKDAKVTSSIDNDSSNNIETEGDRADYEQKKKLLSQKKLKKMLIKRAIQNLDENLEELENIGDFEENEIERIKEIIMKKKQLKQSSDIYNYTTRKYSRDFISMHSTPMYKNIVTMAYEIKTDYDKFLKDDISHEAHVVDKLCKLSETMMNEAKNASNFDREATTKIFKELLEFFKNENSSITQYELYKSKFVDALHSYLSLPLKKEESKSSKESDETSIGLTKKSQKYSNDSTVDEYFTIMCRYMCLIEVFCEDDNPQILKSLFSVLEGSVKTSLGNHFSQELNIYNDGYNLAYDLKKYQKRNRLRLVYEPNIEDKIIADEALEKGYSSKAQLKDYFAKKKFKKFGKKNNDDFEDNEFLKHFPTPSLDKTVSRQEINENPLVEEIIDPDSDHSIVFLKRDALYKKLKSIDVTVENSSTLQVIKDFLRNRITNTLKINEFTQQNYYDDKLDQARQKLAEMMKSNSSINTPEMFNKILLETFENINEPSFDENEKALILEDLRKISYEFSGGLNSFAQPPSQTEAFIVTDSISKDTEPSSNPTENSKQEVEEEKIVTQKPESTTQNIVKQRAISEADFD